jgi:hypothetical protein
LNGAAALVVWGWDCDIRSELGYICKDCCDNAGTCKVEFRRCPNLKACLSANTEKSIEDNTGALDRDGEELEMASITGR